MDSDSLLNPALRINWGCVRFTSGVTTLEAAFMLFWIDIKSPKNPIKIEAQVHCWISVYLFVLIFGMSLTEASNASGGNAKSLLNSMLRGLLIQESDDENCDESNLGRVICGGAVALFSSWFRWSSSQYNLIDCDWVGVVYNRSDAS
jgi:hypothetical protein